MKLLTIFPLIALIALSAAAPQKRQIASTCELDPTFLNGLRTPNYYIANWASSATGGEQCSVIDSYNADSISWHSTFSWDNSSFIRGNPNAGYNHFEKKEIRDIASIPVSWEWDYEGTDIQAAVMYTFTGSGRGCPSMLSWVISIWLATYGDLTPNDGQGTAGVLIGSATIEDHLFDVYRVPSPLRTMYIFQAQENLSNFEGDLAAFVRWPGEMLGSGAGQVSCVWEVQGGTEIWGGKDAKFTSKNYKVKQNVNKGPILHG